MKVLHSTEDRRVLTDGSDNLFLSAYGDTDMLQYTTHDGEGRERYYLNSLDQRALRELFEKQRDEELGRWRWPEEPHYVVYRHEQGDDRDGRCVLVVDERGGNSQSCWEGLSSAGADGFRAAARAYFVAHTLPEDDDEPEGDRPQEGETWQVIYEAKGGQRAIGAVVTRSATTGDLLYVLPGGGMLHIESPDLVAARRLLTADGKLSPELAR